MGCAFHCVCFRDIKVFIFQNVNINGKKMDKPLQMEIDAQLIFNSIAYELFI